jgi:toxin HigB-1
MIKSWKHKGLHRFYTRGDKSGVNSVHTEKLTMILQLLDAAETPQLLNLPGFFLHQLKGDMKGFYSLRVSGNWRVIFKFDGQDVILVYYLDYH